VMVAAYDQISALNYSSLHHMATSALLYHWRTKHPRPATAALDFGIAAHVAILEPNAFAARYVVAPEGLDRRTKKGKAWVEEHSDRVVLTAADGARIELCARAIAAHGPASELIEGTNREVVIEWTLDGIACKGRVDVHAAHLVDLKTCRDLGRFQRDAAGYHYHAQIAWYRDGAVSAGVLNDDAPAYLIAVESVEPFDVAAFVVPTDVLDVGRRLYRRWLGKWKQCERSGLWPGQHPALDFLELPEWAMRDEGGF